MGSTGWEEAGLRAEVPGSSEINLDDALSVNQPVLAAAA